MPNSQHLVIVQPKLPAYRWSYFESIAREWPGRVLVIFGEDTADGPLSSLPNDQRAGSFERLEVPWTRCGSRSFLAIRPVLAAIGQIRPAALLLPGDFNEPVVHLLLLMARFRWRIPAVCLGQYRRAGARRMVTAIKPLWHRAFHGLILYNQREYRFYREGFNFPVKRLTFLNNGLDRIPTAPTLKNLRRKFHAGSFLCLGRLEPKNRFDLVIAAHANYVRAGGQRPLIIIGEGSQGEALRAMAGDKVRFWGAIYDESILREHLQSTFALVHPYGLGLSLNVAFGHACPVICCREPDVHMPEFWLWQEGVNGLGFAHHSTEAEVTARLESTLAAMDGLRQDYYHQCCLSAHRSVIGVTTDRMAGRTLGLLFHLTGIREWPPSGTVGQPP